MGNLIVVILTELRFIKNKSIELFFYAFLMFLATIIFTVLAENYEKANRYTPFMSGEDTIETYIYVEEVQSTNLEENFLDDSSDNFVSSDDEDGMSAFCTK